MVAQIDAFERFNPAAGDPRRWFVTVAQSGGGPMMDFGCHRLEVLLNLFGPVKQISGVTARVIFDREVEDTAVATLQFEAGPCATVTVTHAVMESRDTIDIFATDGSMHIGKLNAGDLRIVTPAGERLETHAPAANLHAPLVEDFVGAVLHGRAPAVTGEIGRVVALLEDTIYARASIR